MALVNLKDYQDYKGLKNPNDAQKLGIILKGVLDLVETYVDRPLAEKEITEWCDAKVDQIFLSEFPVNAVSSVKVSEDGGETQTTLTEKTDYFVDTESGMVMSSIESKNFLVTYATPFRSAEVVYTAGYTEDTFPEDLKLAIFDLVDYYKDGEHVPSKSFGGATIDNAPVFQPSQFPPHIKRVLDMHRFAV